MRFPSIETLLAQAYAVLLRFPWTLAAGLVAAAAAMAGVDGGDEEFWFRVCFTALLALPGSVAVTVMAERRGWTPVLRSGVLVAGALALAWFFHTWPGMEEKHLAIRYLQLSGGLHLLVAFAPFHRRGETRGFWEYNRRLFEGFLRAGLFSAVLFVGLAIALAALDQLFGADVAEETYARLWFFIAFIVNTWIFLAAVPRDFGALDDTAGYPRALKVFTQYILTPLVAVYLVILLAYLVKIIITGTWPSGWIGYLVSSVAAVGILGFLLVHPLRFSEGEGWIRTYARWLFVGLVPAAIMFLLALWKRAEPYGLTELRFLGFILGAWLLGIAILYTVRRESGIRVIPTSLAILIFFTAFGPLGATAFSVRSQAARIQQTSESAGIRLLGRVPEEQPEVREEDLKQISDALRFLVERNAIGTISRLFGDAAATIPPRPEERYQRHGWADSAATLIMARVNLKYLPPYYQSDVNRAFSIDRTTGREATPVAGYDYRVRWNPPDSVVMAGPDTMLLRFDSLTAMVSVLRGPDTVAGFELRPLADSVRALPPAQQGGSPLVAMSSRGPGRGMLLLEWLGGYYREGQPVFNGWRGEIFLGGLTH